MAAVKSVRTEVEVHFPGRENDSVTAQHASPWGEADCRRPIRRVHGGNPTQYGRPIAGGVDTYNDGEILKKKLKLGQMLF